MVEKEEGEDFMKDFIKKLFGVFAEEASGEDVGSAIAGTEEEPISKETLENLQDHKGGE